MNNYFYDANNIRCNLIQSRSGPAINWIFVPGGPGIDSSYLKTLTSILDLPGNMWLIDLPGNGDHLLNVAENYNFDQWFDIFNKLIMRFDNPVIIGHSFGGMLALLDPKLETKLAGLISLNSAPCLWMEEAAKAATQDKLPDLTPAMTEFVKDPTQITFDAAVQACLPYYFPANSMPQGKALFNGLPFRFQAAVWFQNKAVALNYTAQWAPKKLPMLIISATKDYICPPALFQRDERFKGENITSIVLEDAGHFPWIEKPQEVAAALKEFSERVIVR